MLQTTTDEAKRLPDIFKITPDVSDIAPCDVIAAGDTPLATQRLQVLNLCTYDWCGTLWWVLEETSTPGR